MDTKIGERGKEKLVCRYTGLALRYASIPRGVSWVPEYEEEGKILLEEMLEIRKLLGMERGNLHV